MNRGTKCRSALLGALALLGAFAPVALAAPAAVEEYVLTLPGVEQPGAEAANPDPGTPLPGGGGVSGDDERTSTPLAALADAASSPAAVLLAVGLVAGLIGAGLRRRS